MRIVHYLSSLTRTAGGLYYSVSGLAKAQQALGADVSVYGGADATFDIDRHIWGSLPLVPHKLTDLYGFAPSALRAFGRIRPDIVHIHGIWTAASIYGRLAAARGIPTVIAPRGMLDPWILARRSHFKAIHAALFERPLLRASTVHALNEPERRSIEAYLAPEPSPIFVIPNGIALAERPGDPHRSGALYLGRLHEKKQVLELLDHWLARPELADVTLTVAGWGSDDYTAAVSERCAKACNLEFVGAAYEETKAKLFAQSAFFILPSLSEGLPMAVLEALSAGCIPIITRQCNLTELIDHGNAIEMQSDFSDFPTIAASLAAMSRDERADRSARATREAHNYAWPRIAAVMLERYEDILARRR